MHIVKRDNKKFYVEKIKVNGAMLKSPEFETREEARVWKAKMTVNISVDGTRIDKFAGSKNLTVKEYALQYLEFNVKAQWRHRTYLIHKATFWNHVFPLCGHMKMHEVSLATGYLLMSKLKDNNHTTGGINIIMRSFRTMLSHAVKEGIILSNPLDSIKNLRKYNPRETFMSKEEIDDLIKYNIGHPRLDFILFALNTGMRRGEIGGLLWDCILMEQRLILVKRTRDWFGLQETTKSGEKRYVPMNNFIFNLLRKIKGNKDPNEYVFRRESGDPVNVHHLYRDFKIMLENAEIKKQYRFHDLRHTFASHFMMKNGSVFDLQKILGHSKTEMTMRYAHLAPDYLTKAISIINFDLNSK